MLNIYRGEGINSYFTEKVSYSSMLPVRAPVGASGNEKKRSENGGGNGMDEHAGFMFLVCLRWTKLMLRINCKRMWDCESACGIKGGFFYVLLAALHLSEGLET